MPTEIIRAFLVDYIEAAGLEYSMRSSPLLRSTIRRTKQLTQNGMTANDISRMVKRRLRDASLPNCFSPHSFRVATITDLLSQGFPLPMCKHLPGMLFHEQRVFTTAETKK